MSNGCLDPSPQISLTFTGAFPSPRALRATPVPSPRYGNSLQNLGDGIYSQGIVDLNNSGTVSSLPSPATLQDGQIVRFQGDGYSWLFAYNATSLYTNKWEFVGGPPLYTVLDDAGTLSPGGSDQWADPGGSGPGPSLQAPLNATYIVDFGFHGIPAAVNHRLQMGIALAGVLPADSATTSIPATITDNLTNYGASSRRFVSGGMQANDVFKAVYRDGASSGTSHIAHRWISITPIRAV